MADIFVGSVAVGVVPDARGWEANLSRQLAPSADRIGRDYGDKMGKKIAEQMGQAGSQSGGAFGDTFRKRLDAALKALPKATLDGDSGPVDRKLDEIRKRIEAIHEQGLINPDKALKDIAIVTADLDKLARKSKDIPLRFNTAEARAQLDLLKRDAASAGGGGGGILSNLPLIGGLFGGGGSAATGAAGQGASAGGGAFSNPYVLVGGIAAGAAALPFLGQAAGGLLTGGLGAAVAAPGILGAFGLGTTAAPSTQQMGAASAAVAASQANLNKLRASGKTTAVQLATAEAQLATNQAKLNTLQKQAVDPTRITAGQQAVRKSFTDMKNNIIGDLSQVGVAFQPVLIDIANTISHVFKQLTPLFKTVSEVIRGPLDVFVTTIINQLTSPAVVQAIKDVSTSFVNILQAFTPDIPGIAASLAQAISGMAKAISANPKGFADFLNFMFQVVIFAVRMIEGLTYAANWIEAHWQVVKWVAIPVITAVDLVTRNFTKMKENVILIFTDLGHNIEHIWDMVWNNTVGRTERGWHDVVGIYNRLRTDVINWLHNVQNTSAQVWDTVWNNTVGRATRGAQDVFNVFVRLKTNIVNWFHDAINWLENAGVAVIQGLMNGMKNGMADIGNWVNNNIVQPVLHWVKSHFGIASPASAMIPVGKNIVAGMLHGIFASAHDIGGFIGKAFGGWPQALGSFIGKSLIDVAKLPAKALSALGSVAGKIGGFFAHLFGGGTGGGVQRWAGLVAQALAMLGMPLSLTSQVLYQMQTESGGNPNAINLTDINAQMGDPSRGLLQVIGSTFAAYHVPGTSTNIYDPLANIAAAINYARATYGPTLMRGGMGMGSGHGYDAGGLLPPGITLAVNRTGRPEIILTQDQFSKVTRGSDGVAYHAHFDGLTGAAIEQHVQTAFQAMSLTQGHLNRQGRRS